MSVELAPCPNCGEGADYYPETEGQASAIYCRICPLGAECSGWTEAQLAKLWNSLPRVFYSQD